MILRSLFILLAIPLISMAIEPINPKGLCDRYIKSEDQKKCIDTIDKEDIDWYAAGICNMQKDEILFQKCMDTIRGQSFQAKALETCSDETALSDLDRIACLEKSKERMPASTSPFQPLVIQKKTK